MAAGHCLEIEDLKELSFEEKLQEKVRAVFGEEGEYYNIFEEIFNSKEISTKSLEIRSEALLKLSRELTCEFCNSVDHRPIFISRVWGIISFVLSEREKLINDDLSRVFLSIISAIPINQRI